MPKKPTKGTGRKPAKRGKQVARKRPAKAAKPPETEVPTDLVSLVKYLVRCIKQKLNHLEVPEPLPAGTVGPEIPLDAGEVQQLFVAAATQGNQGSQIWERDENELLVLTANVRVRLDDGLVVVTIPVSSDQTGNVSVEVPFAVGSQDKPAGMVVAVEERPRGPAQIVDLWGESLVAFAWRIFLSVTTKVAFNTGDDQDREGLIPAALTASREGLGILTMARHTFDRVVK